MRKFFIKYLAILQAYCCTPSILLQILLLLILSNVVIHGQNVFNHDDKNNSNSNETRIIDCESKANSLSKFNPPDLEIVYGNWTPILKFSGNQTLVKKDKNEAFDLNFSCKAMYPVHLLHEIDSPFFDDGKGIQNKGSWEVGFRNKVFYTDFYDPSTYEFYVRESMRFFNIKSQTFSCQSIEYPCLQHTAEISFSNKSSQLHIELNPSSKLGFPLPFMEIEESSSNETDCEAFYYYEVVESGESTPTYKFRCEFSDGSPGLIQQIKCNNLLKCEGVQRYKPQQHGCWREWSDGVCESCQYERETTFTAFVATCVKDSADYEETSMSSLAFYGVPQEENSTRPEIFFSVDHVNQSEMIHLKTFPDGLQKFKSVLHVECLLSGYFTSAAFQFALEIKGESELYLLPLSAEGQTNWISSGIGAWKNKIDIILNDTRINKVYCFGQIQNKYEWINVSRHIHFETDSNIDGIISTPNQFIMSVVSFGLAAFLLFIAVPCIFFIFIKRERRNLTKEEMDGFRFGTSKWKKLLNNSKNIYALPYDVNYEVPRKFIDLCNMKVIGSGEFGVVIKGKLRRNGKNQVPIKTAIKIIKSKYAKDFLEFLDEIKIMTYLGTHENIVCLIAACTSSMEKCEAFACLEYCKNGSLKKFLPKHKDNFEDLFRSRGMGNLSNQTMSNGLSPYVQTTIINNEMTFPTRNIADDYNKILSTLNLLSFAWDIANGMNYLTEMKLSHCDLAARNILLSGDLRAKVGDFGMSIKIDQNANYVRKEVGHKPWRWLSLESLKLNRYSVESDVFSYGVVLYEIFSLGDDPWEDMEYSREFIIRLMDGERMEKPNLANDSIYSLMLKCWNNTPSERPTFMDIQHDILQEIRNLRPTNNYTVDILSSQDNYSYEDDGG